MHIRKTGEADLARVMEIYAHAQRFMAQHGNPNQWGKVWPPVELIRQDIACGKSYVCEHLGQIVGTFFYDYGQDVEPTYTAIEDGAWLESSPYGVVHRIASSGEVPGVGTLCITWAFGQSGHLRIDTHGDNLVMQGLLAKLGFTHTGTIHVREDHDPRLAYEKVRD